MSRHHLLFFLFCLCLTLFALFSSQIGFHDEPEYYALARAFAGYQNQAVFTSHSLLYPYLSSFFLSFFPSLVVLKLFSLLWIALTALVLMFSDQRAFLLFLFSPLVWMTSIAFSPILPAMFFMAALHVAFLYWQKTRQFRYFVLSGLSFGFAFAFYTAAIVPLLFFVFAYLRQETLQQTLIYLCFTLPGLFLRSLLDAIYTGFPFYSYVRDFGANLKVILGQSTTDYGFFHGLFVSSNWFIFFVCAPLFFLIYRLRAKSHISELWYLAPSFLFFFVRGGLLKYFLLIVPSLLLLLAPLFSRREMWINALFGVLLTIFFTWGYFGNTWEQQVTEDLSFIEEEYSFQRAVMSPAFSFLDFSGRTYIWPEEYVMAQQNITYFSGLSVASQSPRIAFYEELQLHADLVRTNTDSFADITYWIAPATFDLADSFTTPYLQTRFVQDRCYPFLCVYRKI